jgi:transcriptional adapter 2-alpha
MGLVMIKGQGASYLQVRQLKDAKVRINCDVCSDYDLCVQCFADGKSSRDHDPATHSYRVIEQHSIPIYCEDWGADEELLLLEGAETYGLGSWADIADHIGGCRTKDDVRDHYINTYINSSRFPLPEHASPADTTFIDKISREDFQAQKKRRIDKRKDDINNAPPAQPKQKPTASVPSCHEVQGFMPGRLEFETEYFNEAEEAVQHMQFDPGDGAVALPVEQQQELDLKMVIMDIYNERLSNRVERKKIIFEHHLLDYKTNQAKDKKRTKEEKDLINRAKPFARMMRHDDYDTFCNGLEYEHQLRQAIGQLQEWRQMQITELKEGIKYEAEKQNRATRGPLGAFDRLQSRGLGKPTPPIEQTNGATNLISPDLPLKPFASGLNTPPASEDGSIPNGTATNGIANGILTPQSTAKPKFNVGSIPGVTPRKLDGDADVHLLTQEEKDLCRVLKLQPKPYVMIKEAVLKESIEHGGALKRKTVKELARVEAVKANRLFDWFVQSGLIAKA